MTVELIGTIIVGLGALGGFIAWLLHIQSTVNEKITTAETTASDALKEQTKHFEKAIGDVRNACEKSLSQMRDDHANARVALAEKYASIAYLKDVESRTMGHLDRIEKKVDRLIERTGAES